MIRKLGSFLAVALLAAACGGAQDGDGDGTGTGTGSEVAVVVDCSTVAAAVTVTTPGFRFEPKTANIQVGDVVRFDPSSGLAIERRPVRHVPLVGDVAAGTDVLAQENVEELFPLPEDFTGTGDLFMLRVRGDSMIDVGIMDGDFVVARAQETAVNGEIVIAGIPGEEATVKTFQRKGSTISLIPANPRLEPLVFDADQVQIFGRVVTVMRRL